jgi:hypothetical protein
MPCLRVEFVEQSKFHTPSIHESRPSARIDRAAKIITFVRRYEVVRLRRRRFWLFGWLLREGSPLR